MSADESFLARWSRRKRTVAVQPDTGETPPPNPAESAKPVDAPLAPPLPPIELIECSSDIKPFLAPGVPLELTRAALRRAWAADPAIRDFIGLSENAWDFNALDEVPGFGSLDLDKVSQLAAQLLGEPRLAPPLSTTATFADCSATSPDPPVTIIERRESIAQVPNKNGQEKLPNAALVTAMAVRSRNNRPLYLRLLTHRSLQH